MKEKKYGEFILVVHYWRSEWDGVIIFMWDGVLMLEGTKMFRSQVSNVVIWYDGLITSWKIERVPCLSIKSWIIRFKLGVMRVMFRIRSMNVSKVKTNPFIFSSLTTWLLLRHVMKLYMEINVNLAWFMAIFANFNGIIQNGDADLMNLEPCLSVGSGLSAFNLLQAIIIIRQLAYLL